MYKPDSSSTEPDDAASTEPDNENPFWAYVQNATNATNTTDAAETP